MKTIKIIDLLNKIAKGEEVPKKIKFEGDEFDYLYEERAFCIDTINGRRTLLEFIYECNLNDEVEIIEEDKTHYTYKITKNENGTIVDAKGQRYSLIEEVETTEEEKEIEKLYGTDDGTFTTAPTGFELMGKINELIDTVNELIKK